MRGRSGYLININSRNTKNYKGFGIHIQIGFDEMELK